MLNRGASLDAMFQALADPARRSMVERLSRGPASVSELARPLAMTFSAAAQHLRVLETSGLIVTRKVGRKRICRIDPKMLAAAEGWIAERMAWERRVGRLGEMLAKSEPDKQRKEK
jgi:DNA-binding transcriptional ArsR family regulator